MNNYARVIDILSRPETVKDAILLEIAKREPSAIVRACDRISLKQGMSKYIENQNSDKYLKELAATNYVGAIKARREQSGDSLKDAKDYMDKLTGRA